MLRSLDSYTLDPQIKELLDRMASEPLAAFASVPPDEARRLYRASRISLQEAPLAMAAVENVTAEGPAGPLPVRIYKPFPFRGQSLSQPTPCLIYFHGGGWTLGDLDSHDGLCRALAYQGQCAVASVAYRLAPEHRFPAAAEDAVAAVRWIASAAPGMGLDGARIAVGGDSAGGSLAAVAALAFREAKLCMQLLLYPSTDMAHDMPSHRRFSQGYGLTREDLLWCRSNYLHDGAEIADWRASPLRAPSHAGLPPACIITAGFDPLLDEGRAYAECLHAAGVQVMYECFGGMIHGFMLMTGRVAASRHAIYRAGQALRAAFGGVSLQVAPLRQHHPSAEE